MTVRAKLAAKDCCFCDDYIVETIAGIVVRRGCRKLDLYVPEFEVGKGRDCFNRVPKYAWEKEVLVS